MSGHGSDGATALLGMSGFVVRAQVLEGDEWWLAVETTGDVVGCPSCGARAVGHGRRRVQVRDLPIAGRPVRPVWAKRIWRCPDGDCSTKTWSERHDEFPPRASLAWRAGAEVCRRRPLWPGRLTRLARPARADEWLAGIGVAVVDPFRGYATGLTDRLEGVTIVVDHFHAVRFGNATVDDVRRRVQQTTLGHRGRKDDPLYRIRRTLLVAHDRLTEPQRERVERLLLEGDPDGEVAAAYLAKELLREVYAARTLEPRAVGSSASTGTAQTVTSANAGVLRARSVHGRPRSSPTTRPARATA